MDAAAGSDIDIEIDATAVGVDINFPAIGTDCRMAVRGGTVQFSQTGQRLLWRRSVHQDAQHGLAERRPHRWRQECRFTLARY